ncbi:MAG: DUF429 domain-containing protein [Candidatus Binatia bacterium]|nr:DUF429 domain-containing protein [Candidatus Binatia bacterium]
MIAGVDFGARWAGTTVICFDVGSQLRFLRVPQKQDADEFLEAFLRKSQPQAVYIDAPLSLPAAYFERGTDFLYRCCDRDLSAMSPMFLGGLTARAMRLCRRITLPVYEVYPHAAARLLEEQGIAGYRSASPPEYLARCARVLPCTAAEPVTSWHEVDAALAWWSGWRHLRGEARAFGEPSEGLIWV